MRIDVCMTANNHDSDSNNDSDNNDSDMIVSAAIHTSILTGILPFSSSIAYYECKRIQNSSVIRRLLLRTLTNQKFYLAPLSSVLLILTYIEFMSNT